ncbi:SH3 domain-containing protein [Crassaminicella thermophila]|uniref:SH3 domain-containing protein n=1 Tax=Crassaminicella thermophila TaxID=2599308 RepID=A0A5C0SAR0_CRATE|nr:putative glycoside hydrolase [Crassaminicella thermophila]QEK11042.1 SH3 domain-containing protein [Crassaminicella thermophila]
MNRNKFFLVVAIVALIMMLSGCGAPTSKADGTTTDEVYKDENKDISEEETASKEDTIEEKNIVYISASKLNVRKEAQKDAQILESFMKGTAVEVVEEKTNEQNELWYKINFDTIDGKKTGWILSTYTVKDRIELLSEDLRVLDFSPQKKIKEYPNNKRVKVKGVYVTEHSFIGEGFERLLNLAKESEINAFVIDVKDDDGILLFPSEAAEKYSKEANERARCSIEKFNERMKILKENGIYTIARIVTFKDPMYTKAHPDRAILDRRTGKTFVSRDKLRWASPHDRELWEYDIAVAKEAAKLGFNEIQFDYVRFPASNGNKLDKVLDYRNNYGDLSKAQTIQNFLKQAYRELSKEEVYISADIFGLVGSVADDMGLGQYWEAISNVVDYVCPMMYPSHYANGTYGISIPDAYPYETIYYGVKDALARNKNIQTPAIIRPWIQDFTASWVKGHIRYGSKQVKDQIKALKENGIEEFLLWNAGNKYSQEALMK